MIIVRLLSPRPWLVGTTKVYAGVGADIVMESITLVDRILSANADYNNNYFRADARSISALISPPIRNASPVTYSQTRRIITASREP